MFESGKFITEQSGTDFEYKYFLPNFLPDFINFEDPSINILLEDATQALGELNAYSKLVPDVDFFIKMHEAKEATASSEIEGTRTKIDEAVMDEENISPERRNDWKEVQNYIEAMRFAINKLKVRPLATNLLKDTHKILLSGVRGENRTPGELRKTQNWIGGATIRDAHFVPPIPYEVDRLMGDFDHYLNDKALNTPLLIKAAIGHYQFETIHPFLDGNGRLGRLLIVLFLIEKNKLSKPVLYLSDYFAKNRMQYYEALDAVRFRNDIEHWVKYFLVAVANTAKNSCNTLQKIIDLKSGVDQKILSLGKRASSASKLLNAMYSAPFVNAKKVAEIIEATPATANSVLHDLVNLGILKEVTGFSRNRLYVYGDYFELFK
ncbi:Fic family protein [Candidatus Saccharibacteria bacterium]|nr:Fic family protein [Candidatus Saccharibacteria bacterium]